jgi:glutathione S-transferase
MLKVYGSSLSPFVRKVLLTLELKDLPYEQVMVAPGMYPPNWADLSPLGKMPVLEHDGFTVPDSSVICRYLDEVYPARSIYPPEARLRATACWLEEYADTRLAETVAPFFLERVVKPMLLKQPTDEARLAALSKEQVPTVLGWLESKVPDTGYLLSPILSIADLSVASPFLTAAVGGFAPDASRFPKVAAYLARLADTPLFAKRQQKQDAEMAAIAKSQR